MYLKVDDSNKADYVNAGMKPFTYEGKNKPITMSYYQMPEGLLEDQDQLVKWANKAIAASVNAKKK